MNPFGEPYILLGGITLIGFFVASLLALDRYGVLEHLKGGIDNDKI